MKSPAFDLFRDLPHRPPFHMVDRLVEVEPGRRVLAYRHVSTGDPMLIEDEAGWLALPQLMVIEAIGQSALAMMMVAPGGELRARLPLFVGCEAEFTGDVRAGCRLDLEAQVVKSTADAAIVTGRARVDGCVIARARMTAALRAGRAAVQRTAP